MYSVVSWDYVHPHDDENGADRWDTGTRVLINRKLAGRKLKRVPNTQTWSHSLCHQTRNVVEQYAALSHAPAYRDVAECAVVRFFRAFVTMWDKMPVGPNMKHRMMECAVNTDIRKPSKYTSLQITSSLLSQVTFIRCWSLLASEQAHCGDQSGNACIPERGWSY